ncbi:MAG TPA: methyltransferase domain-containing protein [Burkholderiaceae bacterium]|nr:methyltransferase domain-containing protein [Burkholderiaceae bacterium]
MPPSWAVSAHKPIWRHAYDLLLAPVRMAILPDHVCERLGTTSLRGERLAAVLPELRGRVLDIGAGDNVLIKLYCSMGVKGDEAGSIGADVVDWGSDCMLIESSAHLPFADASFDTVSFVACLNHIPERNEALHEARRVLCPGGRVILTMIGRWIGAIGHKIWWYSEDKHREIDAHEEPGLDRSEVLSLLRDAGFTDIRESRFLYGLNTLYVAHK